MSKIRSKSRSQHRDTLCDCDEGALHGTVCAVSTNIWFWVAFHVGVFVALAVDLISFKRRDRELSMRAATLRSLIWVILSLAFNVLIWQSQRRRGRSRFSDRLRHRILVERR